MERAPVTGHSLHRAHAAVRLTSCDDEDAHHGLKMRWEPLPKFLRCYVPPTCPLCSHPLSIGLSLLESQGRVCSVLEGDGGYGFEPQTLPVPLSQNNTRTEVKALTSHRNPHIWQQGPGFCP